MKVLCIVIISTFLFISSKSLAQFRGNMDTSISMYVPDTCKCYVLVVNHVNPNNPRDSAVSEFSTWSEVYDLMAKGNKRYPGDYWIKYVCNPVVSYMDRLRYSTQYSFIPTGSY